MGAVAGDAIRGGVGAGFCAGYQGDAVDAGLVGGILGGVAASAIDGLCREVIVGMFCGEVVVAIETVFGFVDGGFECGGIDE